MSEGRRRGHAKRAGIAALLGATMLLAGAFFAPSAGAAITLFDKEFAPSAIVPGANSTLTFTINVDAVTTNMDFTDDLPTGVDVVSAAGAQCGGTVTIDTTADTITLADGTTATTCNVVATVTSSTLGSYDNESGTLTSDEDPDGGTATATLVVAELPGFSKAFSPDTIDPSGISTLTFTIDNSANNTPRSGLDFTDALPTTPGAMVIASAPNESTTCGGTITATAGSDTISFTGGTVPAGDTCEVSVDVTAPTAGTYDNTTAATGGEPLTSDVGDSGDASDSLVVTPLVVTKTFVEGSITSGGTATFNISIRNDGTEPLINIVADDPLATACNKTFTTLAVDATETYSCTQANVTAAFTNTVTVTAEGETSGVVVSAVATAAVTVAAPTTTPTTAASAAPALALTGSSTGPLTGIGLGIVALGSLLVLSASNRRRLFRRS